MCLAVPGKVVAITRGAVGGPNGTVDFGGVTKEVCLAYVPEVEVGEYVLVHVGFALNTISEREAREVFEALANLDELKEPEEPGA